jgi:hypothetical protein
MAAGSCCATHAEVFEGVRGGTLRALVAEDERMLADSIAEGLRAEANAVDVAYAGAGYRRP